MIELPALIPAPHNVSRRGTRMSVTVDCTPIAGALGELIPIQVVTATDDTQARLFRGRWRPAYYNHLVIAQTPPVQKKRKKRLNIHCTQIIEPEGVPTGARFLGHQGYYVQEPLNTRNIDREQSVRPF